MADASGGEFLEFTLEPGSEYGYYGDHKIHRSLLVGSRRFSRADLEWLVNGESVTPSVCGLPGVDEFTSLYKHVRGDEAQGPLTREEWEKLHTEVFGRVPTRDDDPQWDKLVGLLWRHRNPR